MKSRHHFLVLLTVLLLATACRRNMFNQARTNPLRESDFFLDGAAARPIPEHAVAHADDLHDESYYTGMKGTNPLTAFPFPITREVLGRGRQRYEIYCAPCHGLTGDGHGMVVQRGLAASPAFTLDRLRSAPAGHFVEVVARGYGAMLPQASQVPPDDRWAIAAYIRALQLSQHATLANLPAEDAAKLKDLR